MNRSRSKSTLFLLLLVAFAIAHVPVAHAQAQAAPPAPPADTKAAGTNSPQAAPPQGFAERNPRYLIRPGDVIDITFQLTPDWNQTLTVQPDGFIGLREAGDLHVTGDTVPKLTEKLKVAYSKILNEPSIVVSLKEFERPYFTASGQVAKPGRYEMRGDVTILEAIALAGGLTSASKHSQVVLLRQASDQWVETRLIDVKKLMASKTIPEDVHLRPGDMIFVPQNKLSKIQAFIPRAGLTVLPTQF